MQPTPGLLSFGSFQLDPGTGSLEKHGVRLRLPPQPTRILIFLTQRAGKVVTREELKKEIWGCDTYVDFEHGLNAAMNKLRQTLGDSAEKPRFIETVPGRGYRFMAAVEPLTQPLRPTPVSAVTPRTGPQIGGTGHLRSVSGFLGGESRICAAVSLGYGTMMGVSLPMEVAYRWPDFENWVIRASLIIGASSAAVAILTFELVRRRAAAGRFDSLPRAAGILSVWSLAIAFLVAAWLPNEPIVVAKIRTMTARVGWPKSVLEALGLPILSLVPVQAVFALRYLISSGHEEVARDIFRRNSGLAAVLGAFVPGAWPSFAAFAVVTLWRITVDGHLVENLKDGPYYGLFLEFLITRSGVGCIMLFTVLLWYLLRLNGLEHEVRRRD